MKKAARGARKTGTKAGSRDAAVPKAGQDLPVLPPCAVRAAALWPTSTLRSARRAAVLAAMDERHRQRAPGLAHLPTERALELSVHGALLAAWIAARLLRGPRPLVVGVNGGQGSGKSTLCELTAVHLRHRHGLRCLVLGLDDLYLGHAERARLAAEVHPLLATRGVPGTHEVQRGLSLLRQLRAGIVPGRPLPLPRFDKAADDRLPQAREPLLDMDVDVVLFEGWCVGVAPQGAGELAVPVNALEAQEDPDGRWRRFVNAALAGGYAQLFSQLDVLLMLQVPDFEAVLRWRREQEAVQHSQRGSGMSEAELARFVAHYERLTRHGLATLPGRADLVLALSTDHAVETVRPAASGRL